MQYCFQISIFASSNQPSAYLMLDVLTAIAVDDTIGAIKGCNI